MKVLAVLILLNVGLAFCFRKDGIYLLDYYSRNITKTIKENPIKEDSIYMGVEAMARAEKLKYAGKDL